MDALQSLEQKCEGLGGSLLTNEQPSWFDDIKDSRKCAEKSTKSLKKTEKRSQVKNKGMKAQSPLPAKILGLGRRIRQGDVLVSSPAWYDNRDGRIQVIDGTQYSTPNDVRI